MTERPTLAQVMRRPRWIGALVLALAVAAGFAALGQWQLGSAIQNQVTDAADTEFPVHLDDVTSPGLPVGDGAAGRVVMIDGHWAPSDFTIVANRVNAGELGFWVVGHLVTGGAPAANVTVALGWTKTQEVATQVAASLKQLVTNGQGAVELTGRYMPAEETEIPKPSEPATLVKSLSVAQQANLWQSLDGGVYGGFIVSHVPPAELDAIDSVPPLPQETINWLNLFYAIEWVVFALFALYFWYRLAKDAWQKEIDELDEQLSAGSEQSPE